MPSLGINRTRWHSQGWAAGCSLSPTLGSSTLDLGRWHSCYRGGRPHLLPSPHLLAFPGFGCQGYGAAPHSVPPQPLHVTHAVPRYQAQPLKLAPPGSPVQGCHFGGTGGKRGPLVPRTQLHTALRPCVLVLQAGSGWQAELLLGIQLF